MEQGQQDLEPTLAELRWRSRRGTRELDLILLGFSYEDLTPNDRRAYARLLDTPDPDLMTWLFGQASPDDPEIARLVQAIRAQFSAAAPQRPAPVSSPVTFRYRR